MRKALIIITLILSSLSIDAQDIGLEVGYQYKYASNLKLGLSYRLSSTESQDPVNINLSYLTNFGRNHIYMIGAQWRFLPLMECGLNISNKDIEPNIGINLLNMLKLNTGYSFRYDAEYGGGFTVGLVLVIARDDYYDYINFMR